MESFNEVLSKRVENVSKLASDNKEKQIDKLKFQQRNSFNELHQKHANHTKEITLKTNNLAETIQKLSEKINLLENNIKEIDKNIRLILIDQEELKGKIDKLPEQKKVVTKIFKTKKLVNNNLKFGLTIEDLNKLTLKGKLDEEEKLDEEYIDISLRKSFKRGDYQSWIGKNIKGTNLPEFTIIIYEFIFKSSEYAKKHYDLLLKETKTQDNYFQEKFERNGKGWIFEKATNTVLVNNKEYKIGKTEAIFISNNKVFTINTSFIGKIMSLSDLKTIITFLNKK